MPKPLPPKASKLLCSENPRSNSKFVGFNSFGDSSVLQVMYRAAPLPGRGEVRVKVAAATVNPTDLLMRKGQQASSMISLEPPFIAGMEFSGRIDCLGEGVGESYLGQTVIGVVNPRRAQGGAHCEHVCVPITSLAAVDDTVSLIDVATVPMNGLTARAAVRALGTNCTGTVLVTGGAGAVGSFAIQMLSRTEATVIADAKLEDRDAIASFGADYVPTRGDRLLEEISRLRPEGIDGIIDAALIGRSLLPVLKSGASLIELRRRNDFLETRIRHEVISVPDHFAESAGLATLASEFNNGKLVTRVATVFSPENAGDAHDLLDAGGVRGRLVLTF